MIQHFDNFFGDDEEVSDGGVRTLEPDAISEVQGQDFNSDDAGRYAHWVTVDAARKSAVTGRPVIALCGKVWIPDRDPENYPICPKCQEIYEDISWKMGH
jgi:hypothetical protein